MQSRTITFAHKCTLACILVFLLCVAQRVWAVPSLIPQGGVTGCDFEEGRMEWWCFQEYILHLLKLIFGFTGLFFLLMIIFSGYQIALGTVTGNKEKGKEMLKGAIAGFIIAALSFAIVSFFVDAANNRL